MIKNAVQIKCSGVVIIVVLFSAAMSLAQLRDVAKARAVVALHDSQEKSPIAPIW